jgi:iron complex outermembrane receptor protein
MIPRRIAFAVALSLRSAASAVAASGSPGDSGPALEEIVVTAQRWQEDLQRVPLSLQAFDTQRLEELQVKRYEDYVKYLPSVCCLQSGPGSVPYIRGVASGENNNHSGPSPSVGVYLDEQPITTIGGPLDLHMYDIARVEALAGPQGTLYGASSESGTLRILTNPPDPDRFAAAYRLEANSTAHGGLGHVLEGVVNLPITEGTAIRLVGWSRSDAGFVDNVPARRTFPTSGACISNDASATECIKTPAGIERDFNDVDTRGARAALRVDLNDQWAVTPTVMGQTQNVHGVFAMDPGRGDLKLGALYPISSIDRWIQAALTVEGRIGNFDLVYAGAYLDRDQSGTTDYVDYSYFYDVQYGAGYYWRDDDFEILPNPSQYTDDSNELTRQSHELRIASPVDSPLRFVAGAFYQRTETVIVSRYVLDGILSLAEVPGWEDTIWLTNQLRTDQEVAVFGSLTYDFGERWSASAGLRWFHNENSLFGFFGYNENYNPTYGTAHCFSDRQYRGSPCTNLDADSTTDGTVPKVTLTYSIDPTRLLYVTYAEGYRPGGANRNDGSSYYPDYLDSYEFGWKTLWADGRLRFNGAVFRQDWDQIQQSFIPATGNGLTVIRNVGAARVDGIEVSADWNLSEHVTVTGGFTWLDSRLTKDYVTVEGGEPEAFAGDPMPIAPDFKGNLTVALEAPWGDYDARTQLGAVYVGSSEPAVDRATRDFFGPVPAVTLTDFSAGLARGTYALELYVTNVFDKGRNLGRGTVCGYNVCTQVYQGPERPRTVGIKFSQSF